MPIRVHCACGADLTFADTHKGRHGRCPRCGTRVRIEDTPAPIELAPPAGDAPPQPRPQPDRPPAPAAPPPPATPPRTFWHDAAHTFVFFRNLHNLGTFLAIVAVIVTLNFLSFLTSFLSLPGAILGLILGMIVGCWLAAFCLATILEVGGGEDILPTIHFSNPREESVRPALLLAGTILLVVGPAILVAKFAPASGYPWLPELLAAVGLFFWPAIILIVTIGDGFGGLRPDRVLRTILSAFLPYLLTCVLLLLAFVPIALMSLGSAAAFERLRTTTIGRVIFLPLGAGVQAYTMIVSMRLIGLYYRHFKQRFPWRAE